MVEAESMNNQWTIWVVCVRNKILIVQELVKKILVSKIVKIVVEDEVTKLERV